MLIELSLEMLSLYALTGLVAGCIGGILGLGGGIIIVPALHFLFLQQGMSQQYLMQISVTTSLATIIVTAIPSTWVHHRKHAVIWPIVIVMAAGILLGAGAGALLADTLSSQYLQYIFGCFEILIAAQILLNYKSKALVALPGKPGQFFAGGIIGSLSTLLGIGGGTLTVPYLLYCQVAMRNAVAVSSACGFPIALAGTLFLIIAGFDNPELPKHTIGYLYWPAALTIVTMTLISAPIGARLTHHVSVTILKRCFAIVLFVVGMKMLFIS